MRDENNKQAIESAIMQLKDMFIIYDRAIQRGDNVYAGAALKKAHEAQNALYDAIGDMDDHKFTL